MAYNAKNIMDTSIIRIGSDLFYFKEKFLIILSKHLNCYQ